MYILTGRTFDMYLCFQNIQTSMYIYMRIFFFTGCKNNIYVQRAPSQYILFKKKYTYICMYIYVSFFHRVQTWKYTCIYWHDAHKICIFIKNIFFFQKRTCMSRVYVSVSVSISVSQAVCTCTKFCFHCTPCTHTHTYTCTHITNRYGMCQGMACARGLPLPSRAQILAVVSGWGMLQ